MEQILMPGALAFLFGIISAKWSLDLGYSQMKQLIFFISGLFLGPLILFLLYIRMIYKFEKEGTAGTHFFEMGNDRT